MKNILLGAAAAFAVAAPGIAAADTADVGIHIGSIDPDSGSDIDVWGLDGAFSHELGSGWVLQADGLHDRMDFGGADLGNSYGAVNLGMRGGSHAFYGFVGLSDVFALSFINLGVGGQLYLGNATLNGSIGWSDADDFDISTTDVRLDGTWFFTDNFGVTGQVGWAETDAGGTETDWTTLGAAAAWRFTGTDWTANAGYQNIDADGGDADVFRLGFSYNIGTSSERERSQAGASFNGARNLYEDTLVIFY